MNPEKLLETITKYVGTPYRHGGRGPDGLDCLGLIHGFYNDMGIMVPDGDGTAYSPEWWAEDPERYIRGIEQHGRPVDPDNLQALDLVYFEIDGVIRHAGVMIDSTRFIHIIENGTARVSRLSGFWRHHLAGARRLI